MEARYRASRVARLWPPIIYIRGSHHFWVHPVLGNEENPLQLVRPHRKQKDPSMSRHDVIACADAAEDILDMLEGEV